tara:strand:- start:927 stop:3590 length:2664 start_codon:yes stop_codon:yes gene_type:complete
MFNNQIIAGSSGQGGGFYDHTIDQSLRFNDGDTAYLTFDPASATAGTWTCSFWVKRGVISTTQYIYYSGAVNARGGFYFLSDNRFGVSPFNSSGANANLFSVPVFRDTGSWYHIVMTANAITPANLSTNLNIYVNGVEISHTNTQQSSPTGGDRINDAQAKRIGSLTPSGGQHFDGYLAEWHWIDGTVYDQNNFGEFKDGIWVPKQVTGLTYGAAGYYLNFADSGDIGNNANTTDGTNDWTPSGLIASDVTSDSPTSNFATIVPMPNTSLSEGNLNLTTSRTGNWDGTIGSFGVTSGKWYYEVRMSKTETNFRCVAGWQGNQASQTVTYSGEGASGSPYGTLFDNYLTNAWTTSYYKDGGTDGTKSAPSSGDVINVAADFDAGKIWFGINGTYYANDGGADGNPSAGTNESLSGIDLTAEQYVPAFHIRSDSSAGGNVMIVNFGQEGTFVNTETAGGNSDTNGVGNFFSAVPSGFLALCSSNLPDPEIGPGKATQSDDHFNTVLWSGNSTNNRSITTGHATDWIWIKKRGTTVQSHVIADSVRGTSDSSGTGNVGILASNLANAQSTNSSDSGIASFDSTGFTIGAGSNTANADSAYQGTNASSHTYVGWSWKAGGAPTATNTETSGAMTSGSVFVNGSSTSFTPHSDTTIYPKKISANTTAGLSIVLYQGNDATSAKVPHGLNSAPEAVIIKNLSEAITGPSWPVGHIGTASDPWTDYFDLEDSGAVLDAQTVWYDTAPTSSLVSLGTADSVNSGSQHIMYCFHSVPGYSKFGSYYGTNANFPSGRFILTDFRPAWVMVKASGTTGSWIITDNERATAYNGATARLYADQSAAETAYNSNRNVELFSNGFAVHGNSASSVGNKLNEAAKYIYFAFAEAPFKFANAR